LTSLGIEEFWARMMLDFDECDEYPGIVMGPLKNWDVLNEEIAR
jgi:hypothetical protein